MKTIDEHDANRHAIISTMGWMKEEILIGNQLVSEIEKQIENIEKRIQNIKKKMNIVKN